MCLFWRLVLVIIFMPVYCWRQGLFLDYINSPSVFVVQVSSQKRLYLSNFTTPGISSLLLSAFFIALRTDETFLFTSLAYCCGVSCLSMVVSMVI